MEDVPNDNVVTADTNKDEVAGDNNVDKPKVNAVDTSVKEQKGSRGAPPKRGPNPKVANIKTPSTRVKIETGKPKPTAKVVETPSSSSSSESSSSTESSTTVSSAPQRNVKKYTRSSITRDRVMALKRKKRKALRKEQCPITRLSPSEFVAAEYWTWLGINRSSTYSIPCPIIIIVGSSPLTVADDSDDTDTEANILQQHARLARVMAFGVLKAARHSGAIVIGAGVSSSWIGSQETYNMLKNEAALRYPGKEKRPSGIDVLGVRPEHGEGDTGGYNFTNQISLTGLKSWGDVGSSEDNADPFTYSRAVEVMADKLTASTGSVSRKGTVIAVVGGDPDPASKPLLKLIHDRGWEVIKLDGTGRLNLPKTMSARCCPFRCCPTEIATLIYMLQTTTALNLS